MFRGGCDQQGKRKLNKLAVITAVLQARGFTTEREVTLSTCDGGISGLKLEQAELNGEWCQVL